MRIQKNNFFNAAPNSGETDTITVPTAAGTTEGNRKFYANEEGYDMDLISEEFTAKDTVDNGRLIIFQEDVDSVTVNNDIKAFISQEDDPYTWNEITLTDEGIYEGNVRMLAGDKTTITGDEDKAMSYKIETHNTKNMRIHGVGMSWE